MQNNKRKRIYLGTAFEKRLLFLVFISAAIPATIVAACMYYLIFNMMAWQLAFPEAIAGILMPVLSKVNLVMLVSLPVCLVLIWFAALGISHRVAGPLYRLEKDLDERIAGTKHGPIRLRQKDEFKALAERLNKLICK
jgi:Na+/glutamate symporter